MNHAPDTQVLVIDDEASVQQLLSRWLRDAGYTCALASSAAEGWAYLQEHTVEVVTLDIRMPGGSGLDLLDQIKNLFPDISVLMLTAEGETTKAIRALTKGAYGYLIKPVEREEFLIPIRNGIERRRLVIENREYTQRLQEHVRAQTQTIRLAHEETIHRLMSASSFRDNETGAHIRRTGLLSEVLAKVAGWDAVQADQMRLAAPMHDVGKIGIPDSILHKPGTLTAEEFAVMKTHTLLGAEILGGSESAVLQMAQAIARSHHERWDGRGYPDALAGVDIPECARIVAIVDVYDALSHDRVYRPAFSEAEVLSMMLEGSGTHFDPRLLECFLPMLPKIRRLSSANPDGADPGAAAGNASAAPCGALQTGDSSGPGVAPAAAACPSS
jgi:putative two-component system response regulator